MSNNISKKSVSIALFCYAMYNDIDISIVVIVTWCLSVRQTGGRAGGRAGMRAGGRAGRQAGRDREKQRDKETETLVCCQLNMGSLFITSTTCFFTSQWRN